MSTLTKTDSHPILRWAGGKIRLAPLICSHLPKARVLVEPFLGAGAVFLYSDYEHYILNDLNADLINFYRQVKSKPKKLIEAARPLFQPKNNKKKVFYKMREQFNSTNDKFEKAILFLYLNRHGFNGLCRYNRSGEFNVPFGANHRVFFPEKRILYCSEKLKRVTLYNKDYQKIFELAKTDHVFYCDPPYMPLSSTAYFTAYTHNIFDHSHQQALATLAFKNAQKNIPTVISNHSTPDILSLYQGAKIFEFNARRSISCHANQRLPALELLALFGIAN